MPHSAQESVSSSVGPAWNVLTGAGQTLGARYLGEARTDFLVWAPAVSRMELHVVAPEERVIPMAPALRGYHSVTAEGILPGARYFYRLDGERDRPDPASRYQPDGVHGPSQVVASEFEWSEDAWRGVPIEDYVLYELHVGSFTPEGTFEGIVPRLDSLKELGITAIEIMPIAQFPGDRNWGYDGVLPFAVQNSYGGPDGLRKLVHAAHQRRIAVVLDVVYNHFGPEGNYLREFGPYFSPHYRTPWGEAINFDDAGSDEVRRYFIENALYWIGEFHLDALRLDAVHAIYDQSANPFLRQLAQAVRAASHRLARRVYAIPESDLNDPQMIARPELGGHGFDAQWSDDFHHALHTLLTGEQTGYYRDFGGIFHLAKAYRDGFVYTGQYSLGRGRSHGNSSRNTPGSRLVVFSQNHDQIGNRMMGERLSHLVDFESLKLAAGATILSPFLPLLFMGEEYGEEAPFLYFVSHSDPALIEAVRSGREEEFASFGWADEPPDPQSEATFERSNLDHGLAGRGPHRHLRAYYTELLALRKQHPALALLSKDHLDAIAFEKQRVLSLRRWNGFFEVFIAMNFSESESRLALPVPSGRWTKLIHSGDRRWGGRHDSPEVLQSEGELALTLAPRSFLLCSGGPAHHLRHYQQE